MFLDLRLSASKKIKLTGLLFHVTLSRLEDRRTADPFENIALASVQPGFKKGKELPIGIYRLQRKGKKSILEGKDGVPVATGIVHRAAARIALGDITITIGGGRVCVYWDDPPDPTGLGNPQCHCYCFGYATEAVA